MPPKRPRGLSLHGPALRRGALLLLGVSLLGCGGDIHEAKHQPRPVLTAPAVPAGADCSGFALPYSLVLRESGGDPRAINPSSGAFGCAQLMPENFARHAIGGVPGKCYGLPKTLDGQRRCTKVLRIFYGLRAWGVYRQ